MTAEFENFRSSNQLSDVRINASIMQTGDNRILMEGRNQTNGSENLPNVTLLASNNNMMSCEGGQVNVSWSTNSDGSVNIKGNFDVKNCDPEDDKSEDKGSQSKGQNHHHAKKR